MDRDVDVHAGVDPVGPLVLQLLVGADVEVAVLREHVLQALVLDEAVADDVPAVVALDAAVAGLALGAGLGRTAVQAAEDFAQVGLGADRAAFAVVDPGDGRSEEHTSELKSLMRIAYAVHRLNKKKQHNTSRI